MPSQNVVEIVLRAINQASGIIHQVEQDIKSLDDATDAASEKIEISGDAAQNAANQINEMGESAQNSSMQMWNMSLVATAAFGAVVMAGESAIKVQQDYNNALLGLSSVAIGFKQDVEQAKQAARELAEDGLMSVADAATSLKNLLSSKFSLPEAVQIIERFKDSAAFGRQAALGFGESIKGATEGIKNGNSILVDNAGVTKNLSVMLEEAGYSAQDLMRATEDAGVRQAIFNGIMRETQHQVGDAAKLTNTLSGEMSKTSVSTKEVGIQLGNALEPSLRNTFSAITPYLGKIAEWIRLHPGLAASIGMVTVALLGMTVAAAALATFIIPALTAAVSLLATPVGMAGLAVGTLTALLIVHAATSEGAEKGTRALVEAKQAEVAATQNQISELQRAGQEYASLKGKIDSGKLSVEQEQKAKADLAVVEQKLRQEIGQEGLARIKNAKDTQTAVSAELSSLQEKLKKQKEALQKTILLENEQTMAKIEATQKRIEAVEKESRAYSVWGKIMEAGEKASSSSLEWLADWNDRIASQLPESMRKNAKAQSDELRGVANQHKEALKTLYENERSDELKRLVGELTGLRKGLHDVNVDIGVNTGHANSAAKANEKNTNAVKKQSDALTRQEFELQKLEKRWEAYDASLGNSEKGISYLASKKEYLSSKVTLLNELIEETSSKLQKASNAKSRDEAEIQKLTLKILDLQASQAGLRRQIGETTAEMEQQVTSLVQHEAVMRRLSTEQQIDAFRRLRSAHQENSREIWEVDEQLANLYRERIQKALKEVERAYQDQLDVIDSVTEATVKDISRQMELLDEETKSRVDALQAILDQMDEEDRLQDREKARGEHEKRIKDLQDQRHYHEVRSGKEHQKAIDEINKTLTEEEQRWAEEQARWEEDDRRRQIQEQINNVQEQANIQRESLQEQIEQAQEAAARQRKDLQEHYAQISRLTEEGIWDSIGAMAATEPKWFETGQKLINALIAGIKSGQAGFSSEAQTVLDNVRSGISSGQSQGGSTVNDSFRQPIATISRSQYQDVNGRAVMWSRQLAELLGVSIEWDSSQNRVIIGGQAFTPQYVEPGPSGRSFVGVRQVAEALGHDVEYDNFSGSIRIYHAGGDVDRTGPAILQEGEYVLPRRVVEAVRGSSVPGIDLVAIIRDAVERIVAAIEALQAGVVVQGPLVQNDHVILPAGTNDWLPMLTEGAESWLRGGK